MPILTENKHLYPANWKEISDKAVIRAGYKCQQCGVENYALGGRHKGEFYYGYECALCPDCKGMLPQGIEYCIVHPNTASEWCFRAKIDNKETIIPAFELDIDKFDVIGGLLAGAAFFLSNHINISAKGADNE